MLPPTVLAWEAFWKVTLIAPWVASEASKVLMVRTSVWDAIRSTPGASPPRLSGRTGRDMYGTCVGKEQTKSDKGRKGLMESLSTPLSKAGRDASSRKMALVAFFLLQMGANNSSLTPLNCILKNWDRFDPQCLKKTHLIFLCDTAWLRYPLEDGEWWPVGGSHNYNTVLQLDCFCRNQGKWVEVAYLLPFFSL